VTLNLSVDEVLSTTRAVRKRLDLDRPVPRQLIEECVDLALQAPTGRNRQRWHFLMITDEDQRAAVAKLFRKAYDTGTPSEITEQDARRQNTYPRSRKRTLESYQHLYDNVHRVPAFVIPAVEGRTERADAFEQAMTWGSILPAVWSFMLAARERGLGTVWTTAQGPVERELAGTLGVPYDEVMLTALIPLAFTIGTDFKPAKRIGRDEVLHWDKW
jgi:nitroreductase